MEMRQIFLFLCYKMKYNLHKQWQSGHADSHMWPCTIPADSLSRHLCLCGWGCRIYRERPQEISAEWPSNNLSAARTVCSIVRYMSFHWQSQARRHWPSWNLFNTLWAKETLMWNFTSSILVFLILRHPDEIK